MKTKQPRCIPALVVLLTMLLAACGNNTGAPTVEYLVVTTTPAAATLTPDPCAADNIEASVQAVHKYMREFDDASSLAASRPREQLGDAIAELQAIRRNAEDQVIPACVANLKSYQISHMNSVINTLVAFMGGAEQTAVDQGIAQARELHDRYTIELARVLGITMVPPGTAAPTQTPAPGG